jgi:phosphatidate phosphatase APP1
MIGRRTQIGRDEFVLFFPTYARPRSEGESWEVCVHGWIFGREESSFLRKAVLGMLRRTLNLGHDETKSQLLQERMEPFLTTDVAETRLAVAIGDEVYELAASESNGHVTGMLSIPASVVDDVSMQTADGTSWLPYRVSGRRQSAREVAGSVQLVPDQGVSVVSDIDDTIKVTDVGNRQELLANTFVREFRSVPGMADVYRRWASAGVCLHYVSSSPWQLFEPLYELLDRDGFPLGSMELREFRLSDRRSFQNIEGSREQKQALVSQLLARFPQRSFVLVGDAGEQDPEMYVDLYRKHPHQVRQICIRNINDEAADSERYQQAFAKLPRDRWMLFDDAAELNAVDLS